MKTPKPPVGPPLTGRSDLVLLAGAIAVALCGQHALTPIGASRAFEDLPHEQASFGFALLLLAGIAAAFVFRRDGARCEPQRQPVARAAAPAVGLLYVAVACVGLASAVVFLDVENRWAIYLWAAGLTALVAAARGRAADGARPRAPGMPSRERLALLAVLVIAGSLRFWNLADLPAQVHGDEAACGIAARRILAGEVPNLLGIGWYDIPYLSFAISAAFMAVFGNDLFGLRMASVFQGVASVAILHLLVRRLSGARAAMLASSLLALSHWHIHFSRIGTDYMQASLANLMALFFLVRGRQEERSRDWVLAGYSVGLACSVYHAGRVSAVIIAAFLAWEWWSDRAASRARAVGVSTMALAALMFVAPTVAVIARQPYALADRPSDVFVLSPVNLEHSYGSTEADTVPRVLAMQARNSLSAFNWRGDRSDQHSHRAPLLDFSSSALFAVGVVACTLWGWRPRWRLLALWFWSNLLLGSFLTVDAMFSPRMIVAVPVVLVFPALVADRFVALAASAGGPRGRRIAAACVFAFVAAVAVGNYRDYFELHVGRLQTAGASTILARFIDGVNEQYRVYVYGPHSLDYDTLRFLVPGADGSSFQELESALPLAAVPSEKGAVYLIDATWDGRAAIAQAVQEAHPMAAHSMLRFASGHPAFEAWRVDVEVRDDGS